MLNGVINMEQELRRRVTQLQKCEGIDLSAMYLGDDHMSQLRSLGVQPDNLASNMMRIVSKIASTGIGEKQSASHVLLAAARDPTAVMAGSQFVQSKFNRFRQMRFRGEPITAGDLLSEKEVQTEVFPCFLMGGAMLLDAKDGSIVSNKLRVQGLTAAHVATTLAQMGCFVVFASHEACELASPTDGTMRVLLGAAKEVSVPKVRRRGGGEGRGLLRFFLPTAIFVNSPTARFDHRVTGPRRGGG